MSAPNREAELAEQDYRFHVEAGLVDAGKDSDGDTEWIGEAKHWQRYEELVNNQE